MPENNDTDKPDLPEDDTLIVMGFDVGMRYLGVAVGQTLTHTAKPLPVLQRRNEVWPWKEVTRYIKDWQPKQLLVGYPYNMDGSDSTVVPYAKDFLAQLTERFGLPVTFVDERLSTRAAFERLEPKQHFKAKKRSNLDGIAAQILVEQWLAMPVKPLQSSIRST